MRSVETRWGRRACALVMALAVVGLVPSAQAGAEGAGFIVVFHDSVTDPRGVAADHAARFGVEITDVYEHALKGYAGTIAAGSEGAVASDSRVAYIERDQVVSLTATQTGTTWGLDRINQANLPLDGLFTYTNSGTGVTAYIVDTGIRFSHLEFGGRAASGIDKIDGGTADDCNGHGTHVAGTTGGAVYGVAKSVTLVAVRVLNCSGSGTISGVIGGVDWVTADHDPGEAAVANMSLGVARGSTSLDTAVQNSINDGVSYVVAAGNGNLGGKGYDACKDSPGRVAAAITIGATTSSDAKPGWSNYGPCVDWFAPGVSISSAWYTSDTATNTISGTSMSAPHTAGVAALYLQSNPAATPAQVRDALYNLTTKAIVTLSKTTNNHLLFTNL